MWTVNWPKTLLLGSVLPSPGVTLTKVSKYASCVISHSARHQDGFASQIKLSLITMPPWSYLGLRAFWYVKGFFFKKMPDWDVLLYDKFLFTSRWIYKYLYRANELKISPSTFQRLAWPCLAPSQQGKDPINPVIYLVNWCYNRLQLIAQLIKYISTQTNVQLE